MSLTTLQTVAAAPVGTPALRLASASSLTKAYLVLHTPRIPTSETDSEAGDFDAVEAFVAELLELGGMAVIA